MEPAIEVATLVVSYLWALRDLFPKRTTLSEFKPSDIGSELIARVGSDVAMAVRLADIAWRSPDERWVRGDNHTSPENDETSPENNFDRLLGAARSGRRSALAQWREWSFEQLATTLRSLRRLVDEKRETTEQVEASDLQAVTAKLTEKFARDAKFLIRRFPQLRLRLPAEDVSELSPTRELAVREVAQFLLVRGNRPHLAKTAKRLDYRPLLLRALDTDVSRKELDRLAERDAPNQLLSAKDDPFVANIRDAILSRRHHDAVTKLLEDPNYPALLTAISDCLKQPIPFSLVLHRELEEIRVQRSCRRYPVRESQPDPTAPRQLSTIRAHQCGLLGLCLSGGGIRSATFNLGVLQAMAGRKWLPHIDYLSTVSGGGYIGAWLLAWIKRSGSVTSVQESLRGFVGWDAFYDKPSSCPARDQPRMAPNPDPGTQSVRPIRLLREYSNYLTPTPGLLSADSWTMIAVWFRNTSLNLAVLGLFLTGALMLPRTLGYMLNVGWLQLIAWPAAALCFWSVSLLVGLNLETFNAVATSRSGIRLGALNEQRGDSAFVIILTIVLPSILGGAFVTAALWAMPLPTGEGLVMLRPAFLWPAGTFTIGFLITSLAGFWSSPVVRGTRSIQRTRYTNFRKYLWRVLRSTLVGLVPALVGGWLVYLLWLNVMPILAHDTQWGVWIAVTFGPSTVLAIMTTTVIIYLGLEGYAYPEEQREWWSRLGAWFGLISAGWLVCASVSLLAPVLMAMAGLKLATLGIGWLALIGAGVRLASGGRSNGVNLSLDKNPFTALLIKAAPAVFVLGFLILVSVLAHTLLFVMWRLEWVGNAASAFPPLPFELQRYVDTYWVTMFAGDPFIIITSAFLIALSLLLAWRVDINEFSMHHFYRNRLVRAYLGASRSRSHRRPNAFTGFDLDDDIKLWRFRYDDESVPNDVTSDCRAGYCGPYPLINATLNTTAGEDLAWQDRKGQSFVFSPLYSGYDFASDQTAGGDNARQQFAYRPSGAFAVDRHRLPVSPFGFRIRTRVGPDDRDSGFGIGTTAAISGAAANPNAGYHTSPAVAFLLTVLNARLGWWVKNPRMATEPKGSQSPRNGLLYLLSELFGFTGTDRKYLNLSDGGHFDNMGLYELVRRRCRFIIVCDAEEDEECAFEGIASAIRKCRIDFGVAIELPLERLRRGDDGVSERHAVVGRIVYPDNEDCGTILFLKASLTGREPADVEEYKKLHKEFPHQTTADQFFDESQFESYRALGEIIGARVFPRWPDAPPSETDKDTYEKNRETLFKEIRTRVSSGEDREAE